MTYWHDISYVTSILLSIYWLFVEKKNPPICSKVGLPRRAAIIFCTDAVSSLVLWIFCSMLKYPFDIKVFRTVFKCPALAGFNLILTRQQKIHVANNEFVRLQKEHVLSSTDFTRLSMKSVRAHMRHDTRQGLTSRIGNLNTVDSKHNDIVSVTALVRLYV